MSLPVVPAERDVVQAGRGPSLTPPGRGPSSSLLVVAVDPGSGRVDEKAASVSSAEQVGASSFELLSFDIFFLPVFLGLGFLAGVFAVYLFLGTFKPGFPLLLFACHLETGFRFFLGGLQNQPVFACVLCALHNQTVFA